MSPKPLSVPPVLQPQSKRSKTKGEQAELICNGICCLQGIWFEQWHRDAPVGAWKGLLGEGNYGVKVVQYRYTGASHSTTGINQTNPDCRKLGSSVGGSHEPMLRHVRVQFATLPTQWLPEALEQTAEGLIALVSSSAWCVAISDHGLRTDKTAKPLGGHMSYAFGSLLEKTTSQAFLSSRQVCATDDLRDVCGAGPRQLHQELQRPTVGILMQLRVLVKPQKPCLYRQRIWKTTGRTPQRGCRCASLLVRPVNKHMLSSRPV